MAEIELLQDIQSRSLTLSASLKAVADFLLMEGSGIEAMSMVELARVTYTSKPTLVRFAKQFGYSGWPDFRSDFLRAAHQADERAARLARVNVNYPFGAGVGYTEAAQATLSVNALAVEAVTSRLDDELLASAAALLDTGSLAFFGRPPSSYLGSLFATRLHTFGKLCWVPHAEESGVANTLLHEGDCAIFASYSGMMVSEPLCFAQDLQHLGVKIVAITSDGSQLAQIADLALTYEPLERYFDKMTFLYSSACTQLWLDALFSAFFLRHFDSYTSGRKSVATPLEASTTFSQSFGR